MKVVCGDVGGTNDDLAVVKIEGEESEILFKEERSTKEHEDFVQVMNSFLEDIHRERGIQVSDACLAVAGPVEDGRVEMPHADLVIDEDRLENETELENVKVINDFDAIGYAVSILGEDDYRVLQQGTPSPGKPIALVGAGTGLGKNLLIQVDGIYHPHASEGGHADLPIVSEEELELAEMIREEQEIESEIPYEQVLSGQGLENIYRFLHSRYPDEGENLSPKEISETKNENRCSRKTFEKFVEFYARCCRNYALNTLPENGLFIVGGIAARNPDEFDEDFLEEFGNAAPQFHDLLSEIPLKLVTNYDISLKGAARALTV